MKSAHTEHTFNPSNDTALEATPISKNMCLQRQNQRQREGMTLIELMVVIVIIGIISGGAALVIFPKIEEARVKNTAISADTIRGVASYYLGVNSECPTVQDLIESRDLDKAKNNADEWGEAFQIECDRGDVVVSSCGPDQQFGTEDDIVVGE